MPSWILPVFLFSVWMLWFVACVSQRAVRDAQNGIPESQRGGVSLLPGIPVFPLVFWGVAAAIDYVIAPWGTYTVGFLHIVFLIALLISLTNDRRILNSLDQ